MMNQTAINFLSKKSTHPIHLSFALNDAKHAILKGLERLKEASALGDTLSHCFVGLIYYYGLGGTQDLKLAFEYFEKTGEKNSTIALIILRYLHFNEKGELPENFDDELKSYQIATINKFEETQAMLGIHYFNANPNTAKFYFSLAAKQKHSLSKAFLKTYWNIEY